MPVSVERRIQELKVVRHASWDRKAHRLVEREVTPANPEWLLNRNSGFEKVDKAIAGFAMGYEQSLVKESKESPFAAKYGIEDEVSIPTARLLSHVELLDEYRITGEAHKTEVDSLERRYEEEKKEIKKTTKGKFETLNKLKKLRKEKYDPKVNHHSGRLSIEKRVEDLVLRRAVTEIFQPGSDNPLSIDRLPEIIDETKRNLPETDTLDDNARLSEVDYFVGRLTDYLQTTRDRGLFYRYQYKKSPGLVRTREDTQVLSSALQLAIIPESLRVSKETKEQMEQLGKAYLVFLRNRATYQAKTGLIEEYPLLSLIYDTTATSFVSNRSALLKQTGDVVDTYFGDFPEYEELDKEKRNCVDVVRRGYSGLTVWAITNGEYSWETPDLSVPIERVPDELKDLVMTDEFRMLNGLGYYWRFSEIFDSKDTATNSVTVKKIGRDLEYEWAKLKDDRLKIETDLMRVAREVAIDHMYREYGVSVDMAKSSAINQEYLDDDGSFVIAKYTDDSSAQAVEQAIQHSDISQVLRKIVDESPSFGENPATDLSVLNLYIRLAWERERNRVGFIERQNDFLWKKILNESKWFVADRGDNFSHVRDAELDEKSINYVRFDVDRNYPREHKVAIKLSGVEGPFQLWLDTQAELLDTDRQSVILGVINKQVLENIVLKRLYVITSGVLSEKGEDIDGIGVERLDSEYTRAHHRFYRPGGYEFTDDHAAEIMEDYGINLTEEVKRRRKIGTLLPNQSLTFVRERKPKHLRPGQDVQPNELPFDPSWVPITI